MDDSARPDRAAPHYHRIEQALRARIAVLQPNDALTSEAELAREFGVSRMTARAALVRLATDGLVYREPGRGTFVAPPPTNRRADTLVRFSQEMRHQGRTPSSRVIRSQVRAATVVEAERLRLRRPARVVAITRVRLADDVPVCLERSVFPADLAALLDHDLAGGSLHEALLSLGRTPVKGHASLTADTTDRLEAELLGVTPGQAVLVERRLIIDQNGHPVEWTESRYVGDRYALDVTFDVQHTA